MWDGASVDADGTMPNEMPRAGSTRTARAVEYEERKERKERKEMKTAYFVHVIFSLIVLVAVATVSIVVHLPRFPFVLGEHEHSQLLASLRASLLSQMQSRIYLSEGCNASFYSRWPSTPHRSTGSPCNYCILAC